MALLCFCFFDLGSLPTIKCNVGSLRRNQYLKSRVEKKWREVQKVSRSRIPRVTDITRFYGALTRLTDRLLMSTDLQGCPPTFHPPSQGGLSSGWGINREMKERGGKEKRKEEEFPCWVPTCSDPGVVRFCKERQSIAYDKSTSQYPAFASLLLILLVVSALALDFRLLLGYFLWG